MIGLSSSACLVGLDCWKDMPSTIFTYPIRVDQLLFVVLHFIPSYITRGIEQAV